MEKSGTRKAVSGKTRSRKSSSGKSNNNLAQRYITILEYEFVPKVLHIQTGFKVTWLKPTGSPNVQHVIRFIGEEHKESEVPFGLDGSFSRVFIQPGKYEYYCENHVFMRGEVIVEGSLGSASSPSETASSSSSEQKPQAQTVLDPETRYKEYVSKRQSVREKLQKARTNRDLDIPSELATESKDDSPKTSLESEKLSKYASMVRFGSFDDEAEESDEETMVRERSGLGISSPRFGSFDEVEEEEKSSSNKDKQAKESIEEIPPKLSQQDEGLVEPASSQMDAFDKKSALAFMQERWRLDASNPGIKWI